MTAYEKECRKRCEWCAKGINRGGFALQWHNTEANLAEWPRCTAPTLAQFSEEQAARIAELEQEIADRNEWSRLQAGLPRVPKIARKND